MSHVLLRTAIKLWATKTVDITRNKHHFRGKAPWLARSLEQRLKDEDKTDPELSFRVDIGFASSGGGRKNAAERAKILSAIKNDKNMEELAIKKKIEVPLEEVEKEWHNTLAPQHIYTIADHYGVFRDLYGDAYFYPRVMLQIDYHLKDKSVVPVYRGNIVKPVEATSAPVVSYKSDPESLWTLILTNLDGHLTEENAEYVHWFIGNIPGNEVSKGDVIFDYMPPFPPYGTGFHRLAFVLYKQREKLDFSSLAKPSPCLELTLRTFKTLDFYKMYQDVLTPAGLAFYQTDYDHSVKQIFHEMLKMKEPRYEYDFPQPYIRPQEWFPKKKPFDRYLDNYRDPRDIRREYLLSSLKKVNPFCKPLPPLKFPNAQLISRDTPSWLKAKMERDRLGRGRINLMKDD